eukprot:TRINITY_DN1026_c0_g1_i1.p1 TRINITY_DN1026_c0_g1~~TRINITY_DN1026_c0_g1_i1.p1  ORF type:complete len:975 (+),score=207.36 TRINITY_DN1026_c0_g1_i1:169-3093(+)
MADKPSPLYIHYERPEEATVTQLKQRLETGSDEDKIEALKQAILLLVNGTRMPQLLMTVIRFIQPTRNKVLKKLLLLYWEVCEKTDETGKLLPEMILVCSHFRKDLMHPNEYIRGATLRFVCKMREPELLESLIPSVKLNLEHRQSYVRRNAVLAVFSIYRHLDHLIPDAPELIFNFLQNEGDASCKRNAFIMLFNCAQEKAVEYLSSVLDQVGSFGDILQFTIVELIRKVCRTTPSERQRYLKCLFELLKSNSPAVQFEAAAALISLTTAPTAIKAAASAYIQILCNESDNNVKMIVLDRLDNIRKHHGKELRSLIMDILRALASPDLDIRKKTLDIALDLVATGNIDEVISNLKKEVAKTQAKGYEKGAEYRQLLIQAIHTCAVKYPAVAANVVNMLMDFLGDASLTSAAEVIAFTREVMEQYPELRDQIYSKLLTSIKLINSSTVYRSALWIIGEYAQTTEQVDVSFSTIQEELGPYPFVKEPKKNGEGDGDDEESEEPEKYNESRRSSKPAILSDGTYASQSALTSAPVSERAIGGTLRTLIDQGDFFLASALSGTLTKLVLRSFLATNLDATQKNSFAAEVLLIMVGLLRLGQSNKPRNPIDEDSVQRIALCIQLICQSCSDGKDEFLEGTFLRGCRAAFNEVLKEKQKEYEAEKAKTKVESSMQPDDILIVPQLRGKRLAGGADDKDHLEDELKRVTGLGEDGKDEILHLNRLMQLTGLSDPVYAEAYVNVHQYDILLDVLVLNQTADTLQGVSLELATMGDLKLCERPRDYTIGPFGQIRIKANIKVSSTENGIIFGNIVYNIAGQASTYAADNNIVVLNDIHIDIMDYINPATCTNIEFRAMWSEFEWENKVAVNTQIGNVNEYLEHILRSTNMKCLTTQKALEGECGFLSANLYARSVFGEDALANLSIEQNKDTGKIEGFIRIRSKTQGIALSLGDKITTVQRTNKQQTEPQQAISELAQQLAA